MHGSHHTHGIDRRKFAGFVAAGAGLSLLPLRASAAADPTTLCIMCIDCRYVNNAVSFFNQRVGGTEKFDLVALAGASLAAKMTTFPGTFAGLWEEVGVATLLHRNIKNVIVLDHRDCGAYNNVYGAQTGDAELEQHKKVMLEVQPLFVARGLTSQFWLLNADRTTTPVTSCATLPCPA